MRIDEILHESLQNAVENWIGGQSMDIRNITRYPEYKNFQNPPGNIIYRVWDLSPRRITSILKGNTLKLSTKRKVISFSHSERGAEAVQMNDSFGGGSNIAVFVKKTFVPGTVVFNVYDYLIDEEGERGGHRSDQAEEEIILLSHEDYLTISWEDIINLEEVQEEAGIPDSMVAYKTDTQSKNKRKTSELGMVGTKSIANNFIPQKKHKEWFKFAKTTDNKDALNQWLEKNEIPARILSPYVDYAGNRSGWNVETWMRGWWNDSL